ncbi:alpha/beta hydrolase family esterase [Albirhodobacter sp. R86504]|uniref:alpha/beta hydrolase family esterase n=1 Tax=Albirhodobacter sp. R86504 TaxID=3093848 RepID=UPI00367095BD
MRWLIPALFMSSAQMAYAQCGEASEACQVTEGEYHVALPQGDGPHPAVVFLHGHGSSGEGTLRNAGMIDAIVARGYAVIAASGQPLEGRSGRSWGFHPDRPSARDEAQFIEAVADDAAARFDLKRDDMLLAGFSVGGSMVSYLACAHPDAFTAYAPVAGNFWRPHPAACSGPVQLFHTHGWADMTVPLEGRVIRSEFAQGDVFAALQIWRETNGCDLMRPDELSSSGDFQMRHWTTCTQNAQLSFAMHPGGHSIPKGWATAALDWYESLPR